MEFIRTRAAPSRQPNALDTVLPKPSTARPSSRLLKPFCSGGTNCAKIDPCSRSAMENATALHRTRNQPLRLVKNDAATFSPAALHKLLACQQIPSPTRERAGSRARRHCASLSESPALRPPSPPPPQTSAACSRASLDSAAARTARHHHEEQSRRWQTSRTRAGRATPPPCRVGTLARFMHILRRPCADRICGVQIAEAVTPVCGRFA